MTALDRGRDTRQIAGPINASALVARSFPIAAATTIWAGSMVATNASGYAVPASAVGALKVWGRAEKTVANTVAAGYGSAGQLSIDVMPGVFSYADGAGGGAITIADVGKLCYASDDQTVNKGDGAGLYPLAGRIEGLDGTQIKVALGEGSPWDADDDVALASYATRVVRARNVVPANVADLAAYTVAGNDGITNVEGDVVLLVAQTTAAQNGLYQVGAVATGTAPLTRVGVMAAGDTILAGQLLVNVAVGTLFANTQWKNTVASGVVGTNDLGFYPGRVVQSIALVAGTTTMTNVPILSATKTGFAIVRRIANTSTATTGGYGPSVGGANGVTAGPIGTASVVFEACVAAGTINNADISTLEITVINW